MATILTLGLCIQAYTNKSSSIELLASVEDTVKVIYGFVAPPIQKNTLNSSVCKVNTRTRGYIIYYIGLTDEEQKIQNESNCIYSLCSEVRSRINDYPQVNRFINDFEVSDLAITKSVRRAITLINTIKPLNIRVDCAGSDDVVKQLITDGAILYVLETLKFTDVRNTVQYDASGLSTTEYGRYGAYEALYSAMKAEFTASVSDFKIAKNLALVWGGVRGHGLTNYNYPSR